MRDRILVIEDDAMLVRFLRRGLQQEGYAVTSTGTIGEARPHLTTLNPEIVLLDLMLPDGDGRDFCRELRDGSERLILVLSARREVTERITLLDQGADDYLVKPFAFGELTAHLRALTRRTRTGGQPLLSCGDLSLDIHGRQARRGRRELALTDTEFELLLLLLRHQGRTLDEQAIAGQLWGAPDAAVTSNRVEVHTYRLRHKLHGPGEPLLLHTVRTVGRGASYVLRSTE